MIGTVLCRVGWSLAMAGILLLAGRAGMTLLREPCVGVADNLDYWRVARPAGIEVPAQAKQGYYVVCRYETSEAEPLSSLTSPTLIAWLTRATAGDDRTFDLRRLGLIYWLSTLAVLFVGLIAGADVLLVLILAWVLYDPGYFLFFNSLYADPALIVGLTATLIVLLLDPFDPVTGSCRGRYAALTLASLIVAAILAGFTKMQYATFPGIVLACSALTFVVRRSRPRRREYLFLAALAVIAAVAPVHFFYGAAPRFLDANNFNAVFGGIARVSSNPATALEALGIPPPHLDQQPRDYFAAPRQVIEPVMPHVRELSRVRLAALYLTDYRAFSRTAKEIHADLSRVRTHPRGNYSRTESGPRARFHQTRTQFSSWRSRLINPLPLWSHLLLAASMLFLVWRSVRRQWSGADTGCLFLVSWSVSQFGVVVLGEGFVNLHQHLLGARLGVDLLLGLSAGRVVSWAVRSLASARGRRARVYFHSRQHLERR
jgi:hypothetical protein